MKYFFDTEFSERGYDRIDLISIGIAAEDGRTYYAVASDGWNPKNCNSWVKENVLPYLGSDPFKPRMQIRNEIFEFVTELKPVWYGYYADYDWVLLSQLFGTMLDLPSGWPMFCRDLKQIAVMMGNPELPEQSSVEHNALNDALWNKDVYDFLVAKSSILPLRIA